MAKSGKLSGAFFIGLFVILGAIIGIGALLYLGANRFFKEQVYYVTYFDGSVEGLERGSAVKYQGVPCGRVHQIKVAPDGKLVEVVMAIDPRISVNDSLRIQTALSGLAGGKFLQLYYPDNPSVMQNHPALSFTPEYKYIKSSPSGLEEMETAARQVMNNLMKLDVYDISQGTKQFLKSSTDFFSNKDLYQILANLEHSSEMLDKLLSRADTSVVFDNTAKTSALLLESASKLKMMTDSLNYQIGQMNLPGYMDKFYGKYDSAMTNANKVITKTGYRSEALMMTFQETLEELRKTNRDLQKALRAVTDNPGGILFSEPPPKEK